MNDYTVRTECRLCDAPLPEERCLDLGETPLANEYMDTAEASLNQQKFPLYLKQCTACGHVQLPVVVDPKRLWGPNYAYQSGTSPVFRKHLESLADEIAAMKPGGRVLEIGSNDGTLCRMLHERGCYPLGIDPSGPALGDDDRGYPLVRESWPWPQLSKAVKQHVIVALNVFAHVDDLHSFTAAIAQALAPDGVCIIEVGYLPDVIERGLFDVIYHEHLSYHHVAPLVPFFRRHGLEICDAQRIDSQGGSVRLTVKHRAKFTTTQNLYEMLDAEERLDISHLKLRMDSMREVFGWLLEWERNVIGTTAICGYGCPAKLTTLLTQFKVPLECVYDDNPLKVGRFVPGTIIPIRNSSQLIRDNPPVLVIFSWNFASEMMPRLRALGYQGKFIVPLPEVRVYGA